MRTYYAVIAEYSFGFCGKAIIICTSIEETEPAGKKLYKSNITDLKLFELKANSKKEAYNEAKKITPSLFAKKYEGIDIKEVK